MDPTSWLDRYEDGRRGQVWHELRQLGASVRETGLREEAERVCDAMAGRARRNVELLVGELSAQGFRFHTNDDAQTPVEAFVPASEESGAFADWLEETFGAVPLTVLSWVRLVGDVWLVGTHPRWPTSAAADPLVIELEGLRYPGESMRDALLEEGEIWHEQTAEDPDADLFTLPVAPDRLHKDNVSGGGPYGFVVPDACADGLFVAETPVPFVDYLNHVFANGGFPWRAGSDHEAWTVRDALARDLLPL